ncbi:radical SAM protein [Desulfuromonas sp.]|uniref:radical SAM protein n=1 Tax=Desulfuromonas sp. TaxID=892 RepID=UPI0025C31B66|nr:radical SAM protein [Desulfuromonas sp.]
MFNDVDVIRWDITRKCNLDCIHCYASSINRGGYLDLSLRAIRDVAKKLSDANVGAIGLLGGEPFLRSDILEVFQIFSDLNLCTTVTTNGTLLNSKIIEKLVSLPQPTSITFSFSGHKAEMHDFVHGAGSFDAIMKAIRGLRKALVESKFEKKLLANFIISKVNYLNLVEVCQFLENEGFDKILFEDVAWVGSALDHYDDLYVAPKDIVESISHCLEGKIRGDIKAELNFFCLPPLARDYLATRTGFPLDSGYFGCPLPNEAYLSSDGHLYPCQQIHEMEASGKVWTNPCENNDLTKKTLAQIMTSKSFVNENQLANGRPYKTIPPCDQCSYVESLCRPCIRHLQMKTLHPFDLCTFAREAMVSTG